jgi:hypothetical protein
MNSRACSDRKTAAFLFHVVLFGDLQLMSHNQSYALWSTETAQELALSLITPKARKTYRGERSFRILSILTKRRSRAMM